MSFTPDSAFILAAGQGSRLRPYTDHVPKPMVAIAGRTLIDRTLDRLEQAGVKKVVINLHYKADILQTHLSARRTPEITFSRETELLDTGGGIARMIDFFEGRPFYVIAGDALWNDGPSGDALLRLARHWQDDAMDILTLMQPLSRMTLTHGLGDYDLLPDGRVKRSADKTGAFMWTNIRINHPRLFTGAPQGAFSFLDLMDKAERAGRFRALIHDGDWHHISTPADLERVQDAYAAQARQAS